MSTQDREPENHSTFNNDHLKVVVDRKPNCLVKFDIEVKPTGTEAAYSKAVKAINKEVVIPGFRKGKAPDQLIKEKYQNHIQKEFVDTVLQTGFNEAITLSNIHPLKDGRINRPTVKNCSRQEGANFSIEFECRPEIPSIDLNALKLPKPHKKTISDQQRENALQQILTHYTTYEAVEDRPVQENDFVDISVMLLDEPPRLAIDNQRAQITPTGLPAWIREKIIGLKVSESVEGMTEQDPALSEPDSNFKSVPFRATIKAIWQGNIPAQDDELAKKVGLESMEQLRKKMEERLENENIEDTYREEIEHLDNLLVHTYPVEVPKSYIEANKKIRLENYLKDLDDKHVNYSQTDYQEIDNLIEQSVLKNLRLFFLFSKFAAEHHIQISNDEVSEEFSKQIALMPSGRSNIDLNADKDQLREQLHHLALDRKIKRHIIDHAASHG